MKKVVLTILLVTISIIIVQAKGKWTLDAGTSFGFHDSPVYLWSYKVKNSASFGLHTALSYEQYLSKKFGISASLQYYQIFNNVTVANEKIKGTNYVLKLPLHGHFHWKKYEVFGGGAIQNYRDFDDMALQKSNNFRYQLEVGFAIQINKIWSLKTSYSHLVSKKLDSLLTSSYSNLLNISVSINLNELFKKKNDEQK